MVCCLGSVRAAKYFSILEQPHDNYNNTSKQKMLSHFGPIIHSPRSVIESCTSIDDPLLDSPSLVDMGVLGGVITELELSVSVDVGEDRGLML